MNAIFETERLRIRPIELNDAGFIQTLVNTPGWLQFIGDKGIQSEEEAKRYIQHLHDSVNKFYLVIELNSVNQKVGVVTLMKRDYLPSPDFGFALLPEFEKKGIAFEASVGYLNELRMHSGLAQLLAVTLPTNRNSRNLLERLGFVFQKITTDGSQDVLEFLLDL